MTNVFCRFQSYMPIYSIHMPNVSREWLQLKDTRFAMQTLTCFEAPPNIAFPKAHGPLQIYKRNCLIYSYFRLLGGLHVFGPNQRSRKGLTQKNAYFDGSQNDTPDFQRFSYFLLTRHPPNNDFSEANIVWNWGIVVKF